jgi:large subunit ribosomal protein L24
MKAKINKNAKLHIRRGDTVKILSGDDKGKTGKIISVNREKLRAIVEGMNIVKKSVKPSAENPQGGFIQKEASIHISNLMVVESGTASRTFRKLDDNGKLQRFSKKTGVMIKVQIY